MRSRGPGDKLLLLPHIGFPMQDILSLILAAVMAAAPAAASDITVMSGGAPKEVLNELIPQFESATGHRVKVSYVLITALRQKIIDGETPDMVVMPTTAIDELVKLGNLREAGRGTFGTVRLVAIVKAGAARRDISTPDAFKAALLNARSVVYSRPGTTPSGTHMAKVVADLKIADAVEKKAAYKPALEGGVQTADLVKSADHAAEGHTA